MASPTTNKSELERPPDPAEVGNIPQNSEKIGEDLRESEETSEAAKESSKVLKLIDSPEAVKDVLEDVEEMADAVIKTPNKVIKSPEQHDATHELIDTTPEPTDATLDITTEQADTRPEPLEEMEDVEETPESKEVEEPLEDPLRNKESSKKMDVIDPSKKVSTDRSNINGASKLESMGIEEPRNGDDRKKKDKEDDDIREERIITDNPDLMCLVRCEICNKDRREFRGHLRTVHKMKYFEYKEKYGKMVYTRLTYHRCRLCNEIIEYEFWNFKNHLRKCHDIDTVSYCLHHLKTTVEVTDRVDEMCQVHCSVCNISVTCSALDGHVSKIHGLSSAEYKKQYGENPSFTSLTYHRCKLCNETLRFEPVSLKEHLETRHDAKYDVYVQDFLIGGLSAILSAAKQKKSEPRVPQADITENIAESDGEENLVIDEAEEPELMDVEPDINIIEGGVGDWEYEGSEEGMYEGGEGEYAGGQYGGVWADGADESMFTDNPMQMCQVQCQICGTELKPKSMSNHLIHQHKSNLRVYKQQFGRDPFYTHIKWHRCKLCGKAMLFESKVVCYHLSSAHSYSFTQYRDQFLSNTFSSNNGPSPVSQNILLPPPPPLRLSAPRPHTIPRPPVIRHPKLRRSPQGPYPPIQTPCITLDNQDGGGEAGRLVIAEEPSEFEDDGNGERRITTNFNEGVTARCNECGRTFPMDSFRSHLKNWHNIKISDYRAQHGNIEYVRKTYIRCELCGLVILFEYNKVNSHLLNKHMMTFVAYKRKFSNNYLDYPEPTVKIKRNRVRKIPPPQFGGLLNAFSATMDEGEEINGLNVGSPMQMNGVNGGNQEEMNGMSSINGLQIMNTFSLSKEKSNGSSNEKTLALNKSISITKISRPSSQTNGNAQIHQNETDALIQIKTEKKVKEEPLEVAPFFCEN